VMLLVVTVEEADYDTVKHRDDGHGALLHIGLDKINVKEKVCASPMKMSVQLPSENVRKHPQDAGASCGTDDERETED